MKDYVGRALLANLRHHYHQDNMNAEANMSSPRFRPITVETAYACRQYFAEGMPDEAKYCLVWHQNEETWGD